jgi:hypothetical protein
VLETISIGVFMALQTTEFEAMSYFFSPIGASVML